MEYCLLTKKKKNCLQYSSLTWSKSESLDNYFINYESSITLLMPKFGYFVITDTGKYVFIHVLFNKIEKQITLIKLYQMT